MTINLTTFRLLVAAYPVFLASPALAEWEGKVAGVPEGWTVESPRDEIRPEFAFEAAGGPDGQAAFLIKADGREGLDGGWVKTFPVQGGRHYRFRSVRRIENVRLPRCSAVVKITWLDAKGKRVTYDDGIIPGYLHGALPLRRGRASDRPGHRRPRLDRSLGHLPGALKGGAGGGRTATALGPRRPDRMERREPERNALCRRPARPGWSPFTTSLGAARRRQRTAGSSPR